jgi:hypothetical protein
VLGSTSNTPTTATSTTTSTTPTSGGVCGVQTMAGGSTRGQKRSYASIEEQE